MSDTVDQRAFDTLAEGGFALPGDRVRLYRTRGFDGKVITRVWTVPGLSPEGLRDDLAALTAAIEQMRHEARGEPK